VEKEYVISDLIPLLLNLASDEQDSVRLLSVDGCVAMAGKPACLYGRFYVFGIFDKA